MKFKKRLTNPLDDNKYYLKSPKGYNKCIRGNTKNGINHGQYDVLPNCTGWCYGRFLECQEYKTCSLPTANAEEWIIKNTKYPEGHTARLGSILVYAKGKVGKKDDGCGHVVFVESIDKDGNVKVSESGWSAKKRMWTQTLKHPNYFYKKGYTYIGCIYPEENFETPYYGTLPQTNLKQGSKGKDVKRLQDFLNWCMGTKLALDSSYGSAVYKVVCEFQKKYGLKVDGKFGPACRKKASEIKL